VYKDHGAPGERHFTFFNTQPPEAASVPLDVGMFATGATHINSTYDLRQFDAAGHLWRPGITAGRNIVVKAADPSAADTRFINIYGITEILGGGAAALDDQHHIEMLTNGYITLREKTDDLRVGSITSTGSPDNAHGQPHAGDVTLYSPAAIIDPQNDGPGAELVAGQNADVTGRNISMTAGDSKITIDPAKDKSGRGGIGTPGNFLETNVDANGAPLGVLNATDTASATTAFNVMFPPF